MPNPSRARFPEWETDATSSGVPFARSYGFVGSARSIEDNSEPPIGNLRRVALQPEPPQNEYSTLVMWSRPLVASSGATIIVQIDSPDVGLGTPEDVAASASLWPRLWRRRAQPQAQSEGVFVVAHPVKHIFTKKLRIATAQLPSWTPHIVIDDRDLESSDD
jgi:hypothetical protein